MEIRHFLVQSVFENASENLIHSFGHEVFEIFSVVNIYSGISFKVNY